MENPDKSDYVATRMLECMGVDVINTMREVGINIVFPPKKYAYRVAFVARVYEEALKRYGFYIHEEKDKLKKGVKTLKIN